jgi:hypothetical protein
MGSRVDTLFRDETIKPEKVGFCWKKQISAGK